METLRELVKEVSRTGILPLSNEEVVKYQDLIGHASVEENVSLLNSVFTEAYMRIYGAAYGTVAAIKFYLANADKCKRILVESEEKDAEIAICKREIEALEREKGSLQKQVNELEEVNKELERDMRGTELYLKEKEDEIVKLKARLYDLEVEND